MAHLRAKWKGTATVFTLPDAGSTRQIWYVCGCQLWLATLFKPMIL